MNFLNELLNVMTMFVGVACMFTAMVVAIPMLLLKAVGEGLLVMAGKIIESRKVDIEVDATDPESNVDKGKEP